MCAIFGYLGFSEEGLLGRMGDALVHRGPDGDGYFEVGDVALGNRRLSIIDIEGGNQPVASEDGKVVVVFNGEIYNHVELAEELKAKGHVFASRCDTEVIVHAYEEWGRDCVERFNGMFAFALWDEREERVMIARDRSGQKPLYYWREGKRVVFASEVKALFQCGAVPRAMNRGALDAYLTLRYVPEPVTMFEGIETLAAGCAMTWSRGDGAVEVWRYWDAMTASAGDVPSTEAEAVDDLEALLDDAVRLCMRSDVPVGSYLSGGVDSSLLVALMRRQGHQVKTFSVGFGIEGDESAEAAETAKLLGTEHHAVTMGAEDFGRLPQVVRAMDRPVGDPLIVAFDRMAEAAASEVKVVMSGEGADECFAGYSFHKLLHLMSPYSKWMPGGLHRGVAAPLFRAIPDGLLDKVFPYPAQLKGDGRKALDDFFTEFGNRDVASNCFALRTLWGREAKAELYADESLADSSWVPGLPEGSDLSEVEQLLRFQWREWLQDWALIRQDKNSMAHSLEVRLPFLDNRVIDYGFRSPTNWKIRGMRDKAILRDVAAKVLPAEVAGRPKKPFFFPAEHFTQSQAFETLIAETLNETLVRDRGYFRPEVVASLLKRSHAGDFLAVKKIFSLVILELWHRENLGV